MCYSVESSLKTTALSLFAILYLFQSSNPYFKWIAFGLIGWCGMQFAELLIWMTDPYNGCTKWNEIISLTMIPLALSLQPLGALFGSFFVTPWNKSSHFRKWFAIIFTVATICMIAYSQFYQQEQVCTYITPKGHLFWGKTKKPFHDTSSYILWFLFVITPLFLFWDKNLLFPILLLVTPIFGFLYGHFNTDSRASIWCFYTSFTSITASAFLFLKDHNIFNIL